MSTYTLPLKLNKDAYLLLVRERSPQPKGTLLATYRLERRPDAARDARWHVLQDDGSPVAVGRTRTAAIEHALLPGIGQQ